MKKYDVIVIGGGPSAIIAGITGIKQSKDKSFLMIKEDEKGLVPCGIPYIFHDLGDVSKNEMGPKGFVDAGGEVLIDRVSSVDTKNKKVETDKGETYEYEKLVFATGSVPIEPKFIEGCGLDGVEYIRKRYDYIKDLKAKTDKAKKIIIIGGGFIGCEFADQLVKFKDKEISIVEMQEHCLFQAFSPDIAQQADEALENAGVKVYTNSKVKKVMDKIQNINRESFLKRFNIILKKMEFEFVDDIYKDNITEHKWRCLNCNKIFIENWRNMCRGYMCPICFPRVYVYSKGESPTYFDILILAEYKTASFSGSSVNIKSNQGVLFVVSASVPGL